MIFQTMNSILKLLNIKKTGEKSFNGTDAIEVKDYEFKIGKGNNNSVF